MTDKATLAVAVKVPDVPVMTTCDVPALAVLLAVRVSTLEPVVGLVLNTAPTPLGSPDAANVTLPANPPVSITVTVSVMADPWVTASVGEEVDSVKFGVCVAVTVSEMFELASSAPDVPVTVRLAVPEAAVLPAVSVSTLELVAGLVPNDAVTPVGSPDMASVTLPAKPPAPAIVMVSAMLLPGARVNAELAGAIVKLGLAVPGMVSATVTEWLIVPSVPVIVTLLVPAAVPD